MDEEIRSLKFRRILRYGAMSFVLLLVVGITLALIKHEDIRDAYRQRQAAHNLENARVALRKGDWDAAQNHARSVLAIRTTDAEAGRINFLALRELEHPNLLAATYWLFRYPEGNESLLPDALDVAFAEGPQALFLRALSSMPQDMRRSERVRITLARFHIRRGEYQKALAVVRFPFADSPPSPAMRVEECRALAGLRTPDAIAKAREIFTTLIEASRPPQAAPAANPSQPATKEEDDDPDAFVPLPDPLQIAAELEAEAAAEDQATRSSREASEAALEILEILAFASGGLANSTPLPDLVEWVDTQPQATIRQRLIARNQGMPTDPEAAKIWIQAAVDEHAAADPVAVGEWLSAHGRHTEALPYLQVAAATNTDAWVSLVELMMKIPNLPRARQLVENPPPETDPVTATLLDAIVYRAEGDVRGERRAWRAAMQAARYDTNTNRFLDIVRHATSMNAELPAIEAWAAAVRHGRGPLPFFRDMDPVIASLARHGRIREIHDITRILSAFEPEDQALRNNSLYLELLYDSSTLADVKAELENLLKSDPGFHEVHATLAFAALVDGRPDDALNHLDAARNSARIPENHRLAIAATAHALADRPDVARPLLEKVVWADLLPIEREVYFRMLSANAAADLPVPDLSIYPPPTPIFEEEEEVSNENEMITPTAPQADPLDGMHSIQDLLGN